MGRTLRVDHTRYKKKDDQSEEEIDTKATTIAEEGADNAPLGDSARPLIKEERELAVLIRDHDEDDPMKAFLIEEKKEEISAALALLKSSKSSEKDHKKRHHHRRPHVSRDKDGRERDQQQSHHRRGRDDEKKRRHGSRDRSAERYIEDRIARDRHQEGPRRHA